MEYPLINGRSYDYAYAAKLTKEQFVAKFSKTFGKINKFRSADAMKKALESDYDVIVKATGSSTAPASTANGSKPDSKK